MIIWTDFICETSRKFRLLQKISKKSGFQKFTSIWMRFEASAQFSAAPGLMMLDLELTK